MNQGLFALAGEQTKLQQKMFGSSDAQDSAAPIEGLAAGQRLGDITARGYIVGQPDVPTNRRAATDGHTPQNLGAGVDDDIVLDYRMSDVAFDEGAVLAN